jgi:hypothetical protein
MDWEEGIGWDLLGGLISIGVVVWVGGSYGWKEERGPARRRRGCVSAGPRLPGAGGGVLGVATRAAAVGAGEGRRRPSPPFPPRSSTGTGDLDVRLGATPREKRGRRQKGMRLRVEGQGAADATP